MLQQKKTRNTRCTHVGTLPVWIQKIKKNGNVHITRPPPSFTLFILTAKPVQSEKSVLSESTDAAGKEKAQHSLSQIKNRQRPTFPGSFPPSIIGAKELNFCVRDGYRCGLPAIVTGSSRSSFHTIALLLLVPSMLTYLCTLRFSSLARLALLWNYFATLWRFFLYLQNWIYSFMLLKPLVKCSTY